MLLCAVLVLQLLPSRVGRPLTYGVQTAVALTAVGLLFRRTRRSVGGLRRARLLVALGLLSGGLGGVLAVVIVSISGRATGAASMVIDLMSLAALGVFVVALLSYPVEDTSPGSHLRSLLDGTVASAALWFLAYPLIGSTSNEGVLALVFPVADLFVLGILISVLSRVQWRVRTELNLLGVGLTCYLGADLAYSVFQATDSYRPDSWVGVLALVGLLFVTHAAGRPETHAHAPGPAVHARLDPTRVLAVLPHLPVLGGMLACAYLAVTGGDLSGGRLAVAASIVAVLGLRHLVMTRDQVALTGRLAGRGRLFHSLVTSASDMISLHEIDGRLRYASPSVHARVGPTETVEGHLHDSVHPDDRAELEQMFARAIAKPGSRPRGTARLRALDGSWRWTQVQMLDCLADPAVQGVVVNCRDVHDEHEMASQLAHAAYTDALTGLGNLARARVLLDERYTGRVPTVAHVVLVDLDGFKAVNDTFGHAKGDQLLIEVAARLRACLRSTDEVARIGGDEFVLVLEGTDTSGAARVLAALQRPMEVGGTLLHIGASLGIACTRDAHSPDEVLRNADLAMYASKAGGRNRISTYEPPMHEAAASQMQLQRGLRAALADDRFELHYQPIVSLTGGTLDGVEALLRWTDPDLGAVSPQVFIPVAEECGLIEEIDSWVLERACRDLAGWRDLGLRTPRMNVNVSRHRLTPALPLDVAAALDRHDLRGTDLCIEVTESAVLRDTNLAVQSLTALRAMGVKVALDDFGTGQSSLSQLARLPLDEVKIDRSFSATKGADIVAYRLLTSIVGVCQTLSLKVVAEGLEDGAAVAALDGMGCDYGQGWYFGHPVPAHALALRLSSPLTQEGVPALRPTTGTPRSATAPI